VLVSGREPVTEPDAREALVAEQNGHAPPRAVTGDDYFGVVAHPLDEGQALLGRCPWLTGSLGDPAIPEEGLDTGTLSLQLCVIRGMWRHVKMIGTSARLDQDHRAIAVPEGWGSSPSERATYPQARVMIHE
jgi:hypothetical protein